mgnify:CR=1 FL=1
MKKYLLFVFVLLLMGCDKENFSNNNPYLPNYPVDLFINLSLPQYSNLNFPGNYVVDYSQGIRGIVIYNTGSGYTAFDIACPNQDLTSCSTMTIAGTNAVCPCDDAEYSLFTGIAGGKDYPMKPYRVLVNGSSLNVRN